MNRFSDIELTFKRLPPVCGYRSEKLVSIEEALEPIEPQIGELKFYIITAKKHCHYSSEHGLTRDESAAIYIYTMEWGKTSLYRLLNKALRDDNRQNIIIWFPYLKLFDTALDKLPTVKDSVWRGISLDIGKNFTKDQFLTWWTVSSCSSSVSVIAKFLGNDKSATLFIIETVNGKRVSGYTAYEGEDEVILRIGTELRVKSDPLKQSNQTHIVHLMEIDDENRWKSLEENLIAATIPSKQEASKTSVHETNTSKGNNLDKFENDMDKLRKEVGGNTGVPFVDLSDINGYKRVAWATNAPEWRTAVYGINLEGFCSNTTCKAYDQRVIIGIGMKTFDLLGDADASTTKCPICQQYVEATTCGFSNCYWRWEGVKQLPRQPPTRCSNDWTVADNAYHYFDQTLKGTATTSGTAIWRKLTIEAKPLKN